MSIEEDPKYQGVFIDQIRNPPSNVQGQIEDLLLEKKMLEDIIEENQNKASNVDQQIKEIEENIKEQSENGIKFEKVQWEIEREKKLSEALDKSIEKYNLVTLSTGKLISNSKNVIVSEKEKIENNSKIFAELQKQIEELEQENAKLEEEKKAQTAEILKNKKEILEIQTQNKNQEVKNAVIQHIAEARESQLETVKKITEITEQQHKEKLETIQELEKLFTETFQEKESQKAIFEERREKMEEYKQQRTESQDQLAKTMEAVLEIEEAKSSLEKQLTFAKLESAVECTQFDMQHNINEMIDAHEVEKKNREKEMKEKEPKSRFEQDIQHIDKIYEKAEKHRAQKRALIEQEHQRWLNEWRKQEREAISQLMRLRSELDAVSAPSQRTKRLESVCIPEENNVDDDLTVERINRNTEKFSEKLAATKQEIEEKKQTIEAIKAKPEFEKESIEKIYNDAIAERENVAKNQKALDSRSLEIERKMNDLLDREDRAITEKEQANARINIAEVKIEANRKTIDMYQNLSKN